MFSSRTTPLTSRLANFSRANGNQGLRAEIPPLSWFHCSRDFLQISTPFPFFTRFWYWVWEERPNSACINYSVVHPPPLMISLSLLFLIVSGRRLAHMDDSLRPRLRLAACLEILGSERAKLPFSTLLLRHFYGIRVQGSSREETGVLSILPSCPFLVSPGLGGRKDPTGRRGCVGRASYCGPVADNFGPGQRGG